MSGSTHDQPARRVLLAGDTTLDPLARLLERPDGEPRLETSAAPYGQVYQILLDEHHPAWALRPDVLVVWTAAHLTLPAVGRLLRFDFESAADLHEQALAEVAQFAAAVARASERVGLVLVPTWVVPTHERWIQTLTWRQRTGVANLIARADLMLAEAVSDRPNVVLLDSAYWQASLGKSAYDPRMYAVAKILYSQPLFAKAASEMKAVLRGAFGRAKKVIVCDLDNTLWGGVAADDGADNVKLGAPDPVGECFQAFQGVLKSLRARGLLLTICSKNDEAFAFSVIDSHPAMSLRRKDFVAWRINWREKSANLAELAEELNLSLDSFVFLDDSPQERDQVRQMLPQVYVPDLPKSPSDLAPFLASLDCFETPTLGHEDFQRTEMYQVERARTQTREVGDIAAWLESLQIRVHAAPLQAETLPRAAQLLNKTNQFNLTLRRLDEQTLWKWSQESQHHVFTFQVSDRFGDFGLTGLASLEVDGDAARIVDFVMSCRVMGKKVEEALLACVVSAAQARGAKRILAPAVDGPRNAPAREFFAAKAKAADADQAVLDTNRVVAPPQIAVIGDIFVAQATA